MKLYVALIILIGSLVASTNASDRLSKNVKRNRYSESNSYPPSYPNYKPSLRYDKPEEYNDKLDYQYDNRLDQYKYHVRSDESFKNSSCKNLFQQESTIMCPSDPIQTSDPCQLAFTSSALQTHNIYRNLFTAPALCESGQFDKKAFKLANQMAKYNIFKLSNSGVFGENIAMFPSLPLNDDSICSALGITVSYVWLMEKINYNFNNPGYNEQTSSFTQLVWKSSNRVGFGLAKNKDRIYIVALYNPIGNIKDPKQFSENVLPSIISKDLFPKRTCPNDKLDETKSCMTAFRLSSFQTNIPIRFFHGIQPESICENSTIDASALLRANELAKTNKLETNGTYLGYGENILRFPAYDLSDSLCSYLGIFASIVWYNEVRNYNFDNPLTAKYAKEFINVAWKSNRKVGFGLAANKMFIYIVAHYYRDVQIDFNNASLIKENIPRSSFVV